MFPSNGRAEANGPSFPPRADLPAAPNLPAVLRRLLSGPSGQGDLARPVHARPTGAQPPGGDHPPCVPTGSAPSRTSPGPGSPPRSGDPIPGLYCPPAVPADPAKIAEVDGRLETWARALDLFPDKWLEDFAGFGFGRAVVLQHPGAVDLEHLVVAGKLLVAENVIDDCYCEDYGGSPHGLGGRLIIAQSALDPLHSAEAYQRQWFTGIGSDGPLRSYAAAIRAFRDIATPSQVTRFIHDAARLHMGYLAEAAWAQERTTPPVWKYLVMRQFNNFRPCLSIVDSVDGYELPEPVYSRPEVQRVTALACNAATLVNDLYSFTKEMANDEHHLNLPVVLAAEERRGLKHAYLKAVDIHNEIMRAFERESAVLAATDPVLARYTTGLAAWVAGDHEWHHTNTYRYSLPNYW